MVSVHKSANRLELTTTAYGLSFDRERPWLVSIRTGTGTPVLDLFLGASVDPPGGRDVLETIGAPTLTRSGEATVLTFPATSSAWREKRYQLICDEGELGYRVEVTGEGRVGCCRLGQGYLGSDLDRLQLGPGNFRAGWRRPFRDLARGSVPHFRNVVTARPTAAERDLRTWWEDAEIDLTDDPTRYGGLDAFLPALWAVALELGEPEPWPVVGLAPTAEQLGFDSFAFRGGHRVGFEIGWSTPEEVQGTWRSPELLCSFGGRDAEAAFRGLVGALERRERVTLPDRPAPAWWSRPVYDGCGERLATNAPDLVSACTLGAYLDALAVLETRSVPLGTVWLGPGWTDRSAPGEPDPLRWPDLAGFIRQQHRAGRRVVLAWPVFPAGGDAGLESRVARAVAADGLDADGLRLIDVTPPAGAGGTAALRSRIEQIGRTMKAKKPDALLIAPVANPYFADVVDMVTLGSLWTDRGSVAAAVRQRAKLARLAGPSWLLAVGDHHVPNREAWRELVELAPELGVPVLSSIDRLEPAYHDASEDDFGRLRTAWVGR